MDNMFFLRWFHAGQKIMGNYLVIQKFIQIWWKKYFQKRNKKVDYFQEANGFIATM